MGRFVADTNEIFDLFNFHEHSKYSSVLPYENVIVKNASEGLKHLIRVQSDHKETNATEQYNTIFQGGDLFCRAVESQLGPWSDL